VVNGGRIGKITIVGRLPVGSLSSDYYLDGWLSVDRQTNSRRDGRLSWPWCWLYT